MQIKPKIKLYSDFIISVLSFIVILIILVVIACSDNIKTNIIFYALAFIVITFLFVLSFEYISFDYLNKNVVLFFTFFIIADAFIRFTMFPDLFSLYFYSKPIFPAIYFVLLLLLYLLNGKKLGYRFIANKTDYFIFIPFVASFFISVLIINFNDFSYVDGISKAVIYVLTGFFCGYYLPVRMLTEKKILDYFVFFVFLSGILAAVFGIISMVIPGINVHNTAPGQSISFFGHQNAHAFLYPYTVPCGIYLFLKYRKRISLVAGWFIIFSLILMIFSEIFTFDRAGIFATIASILIFLFFYSKKIFLVCLIVLPFFFFILFNFTTEAKGAATVIGRTQLLYTGLEVIQISNKGFLWGVGIVSNVKIFEDMKLSLSFVETHNYPHNTYLLSLMQFGLITTVFMFSFVFINIFRSVIKLFRYKPELNQVLCVSICIPVLLHSILEDLILSPELYMLHFFLIFFGMILFYNKNYGNKAISS